MWRSAVRCRNRIIARCRNKKGQQAAGTAGSDTLAAAPRAPPAGCAAARVYSCSGVAAKEPAPSPDARGRAEPF